jgi:hypothetical protein
MIVDLNQYRKKILEEKISERIEDYVRTHKIILVLMDDIIEDIDSSGINWNKVGKEHKKVMQNITKIAVFLNSNWNLYK